MFRMLSLLLTLFFLGGGAFFVFGPSGFSGTTENSQDYDVVIPKGATLSRIATILVEEGVLSHPYGFMTCALALGKAHRLQVGEYHITVRMPMQDLVHKMQTGDVIHRSITVVEGATVFSVIENLKQNPYLVGDVRCGIKEGSLLPATYTYHRGDSRQHILNTMQKAMSDALTECWNTRSVPCVLKNAQEALILASIVEKESSKKLEEQPRIAGVFLNRLKRGMPLQADPTVIYGITLGERPLGRDLTKADLKAPTPYNTYTHVGLPPAPIACPRKEAIAAVLNPAQHNDVYFVADGTGGHTFAATLTHHNQNVATWRKCQKKNGS